MTCGSCLKNSPFFVDFVHQSPVGFSLAGDFYFLAMKKVVLIALFLVSFISFSKAQKEDNVWILGGGTSSIDSIYRACRIDFLPDSAIFSHLNKRLPFVNFNASVCSSSGKLRCLSNGETIYNSNFEIIENGENFYPAADYSQSGFAHQGFLLLPKPGDTNRIVQINGDWNLIYPPDGPSIADIGLLYAEIDMTANSALGKVVLRDQKICTDTLGGMGYAAVRHGNGRDWWILAPHYIDTTIMYRFLLSPDGLQKVGTQKINATYRGIGSSFFSPDGKWFASFREWGFMTPYESTLDLYQFDRCSGLLSNRISYDYPGGNKPGGVAFSDSSHFLYVSVWDTIYQYDLWIPDILATQEVVAVYDGFLADFGNPTTFYSMLLAPNKKIYCCTANSNTRYLHIIEKPEKKGMACSVKQHAVYLPSFNNFLVPNMPYYRLYEAKDSPCDTIGKVATHDPDLPKSHAFSLLPNPATNLVQIIFTTPTTSPARLYLLDLTGKRLQAVAIPAGETGLSISVNELPPGSYFIQLLTDGKPPETQKLVLIR